MKIFDEKVLLGFTALNLAWAVKAITYNVITEATASTASVSVIVDSTSYPLSSSSHHGSILFQGEGPEAKFGYKYAIVTDKQVVIEEPFTRPPLGDNKVQSTLNEFFNRSTNIHHAVSLPKVLEPISSIHKIESVGLHPVDQIPTIHIYGNKTAIDYLHEQQLNDVEVKLSLTYISLENVLNFDDVEISVSGRSTSWIPKLSYNLKLNKKDRLYGYKQFRLRALAFDSSYSRENLAYHVLESSGVPASGFSYVRVFMENKAIGLFGLTENIKGQWTSATFAKGDENYQNGNLYKGSAFANIPNTTQVFVSDLRYEGTDLSKYSHGQYEAKAGPEKKSKDTFKSLQEFTRFINESTLENTSVDDWNSQIDVEGFLRSMAIEDLLGFSDGYMTMANNYFLYQNPGENNRFIYIPTDLDTILGFSLYSLSSMLSGNYADHPGIFFRPLTTKLLQFKPFSDRYQELLLTLSKDLVNPAVLNPYLDSIISMIEKDIEWDLTLERVGQLNYPTGELLSIVQVLQSLSPPGLQFQGKPRLGDLKVPYLQELNGPSPFNFSEAVKPFIEKKYTAIMEFYK